MHIEGETGKDVCAFTSHISLVSELSSSSLGSFFSPAKGPNFSPFKKSTKGSLVKLDATVKKKKKTGDQIELYSNITPEESAHEFCTVDILYVGKAY